MAEEYKEVGGPVKAYLETLAEGLSPIEFVAVIMRSLESPGFNPVKVIVLLVSPSSVVGTASTLFKV
jgi:hypothetical protein